MTVIARLKEELKKTLGILSGENFNQEVKVSELVIGGKVELVNSDGSLAPAPDGEYTIEKDVINVKDGLIESTNGEKAEVKEEEVVEEPMAEEEVKEEEAPADDLKAELEALKAETASLKAEIEEMKKGWAEKMAAEETMSADFSKQLNDLNETLKVIAVTPAEFSRTSTNNVVKDSKEDKMKEYAKMVAATKKK